MSCVNSMNCWWAKGRLGAEREIKEVKDVENLEASRPSGADEINPSPPPLAIISLVTLKVVKGNIVPVFPKKGPQKLRSRHTQQPDTTGVESPHCQILWPS